MTELNIYKNYLSDYIEQPLKYKQLCSIINEKTESSGKAKELHLKRLSQYMNIVKTDGYIVINKLYDEDEIKLAESQGKFTTYIQNHLINLLNNTDSNRVTYTYRELLELLSMVNKDFYDGKYNHYKYLEDFSNIKHEKIVGSYTNNSLTYYNMSIFFNTTNRLLKNTIDDSIKSMEKRSLITANKNFRLYKKTRIVQDEKDIYIIDKKDCSTQEHSEILDIRKSTMEWFSKQYNKQIKEWRQIYFLSHEDKENFFTYFNSTLKEKTDYDICADTYDIIIGKEAINTEYNKLYNLKYLNQNVQNKLLNAKDLEDLSTIFKRALIDRFIKK